MEWSWSSTAWIEWHETYQQVQEMKMDLPGRHRCSLMPRIVCGWGWSRSRSRAGWWISGSPLRSGPRASPPPRSPLRETCCLASDLSTGSFQKRAATEWYYPGQSVLPPERPRSAGRGAAAWRTGVPPVRTAAWEPLHLSPAQTGLYGDRGTVSIKQTATMSRNNLLNWLNCALMPCAPHSHVQLCAQKKGKKICSMRLLETACKLLLQGFWLRGKKNLTAEL